MRKGQETRAAIVAAALEQAARTGLEGLTIGALAERMRMSKSGVFAHFGSREDLQIAVLKAYGEVFIDAVLRPALREPRGLPRLLAMLHRWIERTVLESESGCLWISSATEYDDRAGAVRDELVTTLRGWQGEIGRAIGLGMAEGHLLPQTDAADLVFDLHAAILALHHDARLMHSPEAASRAHRAIARTLRPWLSPQAHGLLDRHWPAPPAMVAAAAAAAGSDATATASVSTPTGAAGSATPTTQTAPRGRRHAPVHAPAS